MCKKLFVLAFVLGLVTSAAQAAQIDLKALGINRGFRRTMPPVGDGDQQRRAGRSIDLSGERRDRLTLSPGR